MILSEAIQILEANGFGAEISNKRLRKMLNDAGYSDVHLIKGDGYLYVDADDAQHQDWLNALDSTSIYLNSFNQQSPEEWFQDIIVMLRKGRNTFIDKHPDGPINEAANEKLIAIIERQLEKMPDSGGISCFDEQDMEDVYNYLKSKGYTVEKLKDKIGAYGPEEHPRTFYRVSYSTDTPSKDTYKNWEKRDGFNPKFVDKEIKLKLEENPDEGTIEYFSQGACEAAYDKLKQLGYDVTYTSDRDADDYVVHYVEYKKKVNEDFGIGVGGMTGADQGIPMGGDCKAVVAKRIDGGTPACRFRRRIKKRRKAK